MVEHADKVPQFARPSSLALCEEHVRSLKELKVLKVCLEKGTILEDFKEHSRVGTPKNCILKFSENNQTSER